MNSVLNITSGDRAGIRLEKSGITGEVLVWHDILYDGPRKPGWPDNDMLRVRALFLEQATGGGLKRDFVLDTLRRQYRKISSAKNNDRIVLWFDACLFDQSMLAHILACLLHRGIPNVELLCIDAFPGIEPFHGLGQLRPDQMASLNDDRRPVSNDQFRFAASVDEAFAANDPVLLSVLARLPDAPLPWIPPAAARWLREKPDRSTGLGQLERLALAAVRAGSQTPAEIFSSVSGADEPPHFWGDTTLWAKINALARRNPPLVRIVGPTDRLPQWESPIPLDSFRITSL